MIRLHGITVVGMQDVDDSAFKCGPLDLYLGPMGCGKSLVLRAIRLGITGMDLEGEKAVKQSSDVLDRFGRGDPINIDLDFGAFIVQRGYKLAGKKDKLRPVHTLTTTIGRGKNLTEHQALLDQQLGTNPLHFDIVDRLKSETTFKNTVMGLMGSAVNTPLDSIKERVGTLPAGVQSLATDSLIWLGDIRSILNDKINLAQADKVNADGALKAMMANASIGSPQILQQREEELTALQAEREDIAARLASIETGDTARKSLSDMIVKTETSIGETETAAASSVEDAEALNQAKERKRTASAALIETSDELRKFNARVADAMSAHDHLNKSIGTINDLHAQRGSLESEIEYVTEAALDTANLAEARDQCADAATCAEEHSARVAAEIEEQDKAVSKAKVDLARASDYLRDAENDMDTIDQKHEAIESGVCFYCNHELDSAEVETIDDKFTKAQNDLDGARGDVNAASQHLADSTENLNTLRDNARAILSTFDRAKSDLTAAEDALKTTQDSAARLDDIKAHLAETNDSIARLTAASDAIADAEHSYGGALIGKEEAKTEMDSANAALDALEDKAKAREDADGQLPALRESLRELNDDLNKLVTGEDPDDLIIQRDTIDASIVEVKAKRDDAQKALNNQETRGNTELEIATREEEIKSLKETLATVDQVRRGESAKVVTPLADAMKPFLGSYADFTIQMETPKGKPCFRAGIERNDLFRGVFQLSGGEFPIVVRSLAASLMRFQNIPYKILMIDDFQSIDRTHRKNFLKQILILLKEEKISQAFLTMNLTPDELPDCIREDEQVAVHSFWGLNTASAAERAEHNRRLRTQ